MTASFRPPQGDIPPEPGVYRFYDDHNAVLYVGKAKNLRSRLNSYFVDKGHHPRTAAMLAAARRVDWVVVATEVEALQLEYSWIKSLEPRFNVKYTDDKSYPYLAVTVAEEFPRVMVMRGAKRKGVKYFGPYSHAWAIRETVDQLLRVFPIRTCTKGVLRDAQLSGRPCLQGHIAKCSAPCVGRVSPEEHRALVDDFCSFLGGNTDRYLRSVEKRMQRAADNEDYETAARLRDDLFALQRALEKNTVVFNDKTDADVIALAHDQVQALVQIFYVRAGRITGERAVVVDQGLGESPTDMLSLVLARLYGDAAVEDLPKQLLVDRKLPDAADLQQWLSERKGSKVKIEAPQRGAKKTLIDTVARNAEQALARYAKQRAGDLTVRSSGLQDLQEALDLDSAPLRIEGYDISTLQGSDTVGSMVVFEDGLPRKSDYRRFTVSRANASSDVGALAEVLTRRFRRYLVERSAATDLDLAADVPDSPTQRKSFSYPPQLVVVDGGKPQVNAARAALDEVGVQDIPVVGLAKRLEELWLPGEDHPVILSRTSTALLIVQQLRDEAHRFAIAGHRNKRTKKTRTSQLDAVPGLGAAKRAALLKHLGSVKAVRKADKSELAQVPGIGPVLAEAIAVHFATAAPNDGPVINLATGEVQDEA